MLWFSFTSNGKRSTIYVNLANHTVRFTDDKAHLFSEALEGVEYEVIAPKDVARLRKLLDVEIKLQRLIVPPEVEQ